MSMLEPSPEDRPTAEQLLQHPLLAPYLAASPNHLPAAAGAGAEAMAGARGAREGLARTAQGRLARERLKERRVIG